MKSIQIVNNKDSEIAKDMELAIKELNSGNINSMKGLSDLEFANKIDALKLSETCISQVELLMIKFGQIVNLNYV